MLRIMCMTNESFIEFALIWDNSNIADQPPINVCYVPLMLLVQYRNSFIHQSAGNYLPFCLEFTCPTKQKTLPICLFRSCKHGKCTLHAPNWLKVDNWNWRRNMYRSWKMLCRFCEYFLVWQKWHSVPICRQLFRKQLNTPFGTIQLMHILGQCRLSCIWVEHVFR